MTRENKQLHHPRGAGRALRLLISCNRALFQASNEHELLSEVCRLVVDPGGYLMAWVGFARDDKDKSVEPVASAGDETGYLDQIRLTWADNERGRAPTGSSIRTGTTQINRNFLTNPALTPWRDIALARGYQSSIALPLTSEGAVLGALSIYAREPDAFDTEEVRLLEELARDLAFGMVALRRRAESEHLRAEVETTAAALEGSREQYRRFVELSNEGIWSLDADLNTDFVNPAVCRMLGYQAAEMLGRPVRDFVQPEEQDKLGKELQERKEGIDTRSVVERRFRRKDGSICWALVTATWLKNDDGSVQGGFAMISDITERKRMENALAESRETFHMLVESSPTAINILHGDRLLFVNSEMERISGYRRDELLEMSVQDLIHPDSRATIASRAAARQRGEDVPGNYEFQLVTKNGAVRWIDVYATRVTYEGKVCSLGSLLDVTERREAERTLRASEERFQTLFDQASEGILIVSLEGRLIDVNEAFASMHGYTRDEIMSLSLQELDTPEARAQIPERMRRIQEEGAFTFEVENYHKDGHVFPMEVSANLVTVNGKAVVQSFSRDITERRKAEEQLLLAAEVFEHAGEGVLVTDERNCIIAANPAFSEITGYSLAEVKGKNPKIFASGRHDSEFYRTMWRDIVDLGFWQGEIWDRNKDGEIHAKHLTISVIQASRGRPLRYVALFTDITQKKRSEELIWRQANFDLLTGLPNRQMFHDRLEQESKKTHRTMKPMALLLIDLDRFKEVNDSLGHHKGDMLLIDAAQRIVRCVRESDTVSRLGGDEFVVILSELDDLESVERVAQELVATLAAPFKLGGDEVYISASIGISLYPEDTRHLDDLLKNADQAMYSAKNSGRSRFSYFTPDMQEAAERRLRLTGDLRAALAQSQFCLYYQPIVELESGRIRKAEALLRWNHPEKGMIDPADFIPLAEDTGLIVPIGEWVFEQAAEQVRKWRAAYGDSFEISINKSPVQVRHNGGSRDAWPEYLRRLGLPGGAITVEITESMLMNAEVAVNEKLQAFHDAGICIAIDDFGTGYSSLAYLRDFDVDYLKIDRSFIQDLDSNANHRALCEAIIVMAHKLEMQVVAEGVEKAAQRDLLVSCGCDFGQGFLFARPLPVEEFEKLLAGA